MTIHVKERGFILYQPSRGIETPRNTCLPKDVLLSFLFDSPGQAKGASELVGLRTLSYLKLSAFMYSLTNVTSLAVPFILKDTLLLTPAQLGLFTAVCAVPSFLKPVSTLMIKRDQRPFALTAIGAVQTTAYVTVGIASIKGVITIPLVCGAMLVHSMATSVGMVLRDSMMIESAARLESDSAAHFLFSDVSLIQRIGLLPVSYLSGFLLSYVSPGSVILGAAICPAVMTIAASFLEPIGQAAPEESTQTELGTALDRIKDRKNGLLSTTTGRGLLLSFVPSYTDAMFYFYTTGLGLSPEFLGRFQFLGCVAALTGNLISRYSSNPRRLANASNIFLIPLYASVLLITSNISLGPIPIGSFILVRHFLIDFLASLSALPAAVQLMRSAPKGAEGTYLALTGTLNDMSNVFNSILSAGVLWIYGVDGHNFSHLSDVVVLSVSGTASMLPAVLFYDKDDVEITRGRSLRSKTTIEELSEDDETSPRRGA
jgi:hypothetical protein